MKRGTPEHPKIEQLAEAIAERWSMPRELALNSACGMAERLWHFVARYAPRGDVGRHSDFQIAGRVGWPGDPHECIQVLIGCQLLDEHPEVRLWVHDWHEHADNTCRKALEDKEVTTFANGKPVRRPIGQATPAADPPVERDDAAEPEQLELVPKSSPGRDQVTTPSQLGDDSVVTPSSRSKPSQAEPIQAFPSRSPPQPPQGGQARASPKRRSPERQRRERARAAGVHPDALARAVDALELEPKLTDQQLRWVAHHGKPVAWAVDYVLERARSAPTAVGEVLREIAERPG